MELLKRVVIREARIEDDAVVGELLVEAFITQYAKKLPEVVYTEERKRGLRDVAGKRAVAKVLVAEVDGRVVGTVALWPPGAPGSEAWLPDAADLRHLATSVEFHGQGLSTPLLDEAERVAREDWHVSAIYLHVRRGPGFLEACLLTGMADAAVTPGMDMRESMDGCFRLRFTAANDSSPSREGPGGRGSRAVRGDATRGRPEAGGCLPGRGRAGPRPPRGM